MRKNCRSITLSPNEALYGEASQNKTLTKMDTLIGRITLTPRLAAGQLPK